MPDITTFMGISFDPIEPRPELIDARDIAQSLANQCRFNGHVPAFYSVAQHSVLVAQRLRPSLRRWGLLHDSAEAYLGDVVRPLKGLTALRTGQEPGPEWETFERREQILLELIAEKFGLCWPMPEEVHHEDNAVLGFELFWIKCTRKGFYHRSLHTFEPWAPEQARREWIKALELTQ